MPADITFRTAVNGFNKSEVLAYIDKLLTEKKELKNKNIQLERELSDCRFELSSVRDSVASEQTTACENCEKAKIAQAQLGAAMMDAKRFSELLVKNANDQAAAVLNEAMATVEASKETAQSLADEMQKTKASFESYLTTMNNAINTLIRDFDAFKSGVEAEGINYNFHTDFAVEQGDKTV